MMLFVVLIAGFTICLGHSVPAMPAGTMEEEVTWTFGFGRDAVPYEFLDAETGEMQGFGVDITRAACEYAGKKCEFIGYKDYNLCWNGETSMAHGLSNRYFDACVNWFRTMDRDLVYGHSTRFAQEPAAYVYAKKDQNINENDIMIANNYKVSIRSSWYTDAACLRKDGINVDDKNIVFSNSPASQAAQLRNGEVDLAFIENDAIDASGEFQRVGAVHRCSLGGVGIMVRKDMTKLLNWLNPAIAAVVASDDYARLCYIAKKAYGADPMCFKKEN